jgi:methylmalonyl-CoA mutase, N-terminal domain
MTAAGHHEEAGRPGRSAGRRDGHGRTEAAPTDDPAGQLARWVGEHDGADRGPAAASASGLPLKVVYTPLDFPGGWSADQADRYLTDLGMPGSWPFTRGISPRMYRDQPWIMGQYSGYASPQETNLRIRELLSQGQRGFSIALDLPTQHGLDSDDPRSAGEVGRVGVPLDTVADMEAVLTGIPLDEIAQMRTTANAIGPIAVAFFVVAAERLGYPASSFRVLLQNDVLKEYVARGTYIFPPEPGAKFAVDAIEYCARNLPHWQPIQFCGYHIRDAGSTAVQEVAVALANGMEYLGRCAGRGLSIDDVAPHIVMFLSAGQDLFEEAAKFRAARRIWARLMTERFGAAAPESSQLRIFAYTLGSPQTAQEPENNIVRIAYQVLAAVLGGVQTLATTSYDEALGLPSPSAVGLSLRTQQIAAFETGIRNVADPLGGSYYVESLTASLEDAITGYLTAIEERGGALAVLDSGWLAGELESEAYRQAMAVEVGSRAVVGVNAFTDGGPPPTGYRPFTMDARTEQEQIRRLGEVKAARDPAVVRRALGEVTAAARSGVNTVPSLLAAVRVCATIGEITRALAAEWGLHDEYHPRAV